MLDPKTIGGGGGLPPTIEFDKEGNRKVTKDLGVDGKLKLKSLVSASNPDGDITKELGGGTGGGETIHLYSIMVNGISDDRFYYIASSKNDYKINDSGKFISNFAQNAEYADLWKLDKEYAASGFFYKDAQMCQVFKFKISGSDSATPYKISVLNPSTKKIEDILKNGLSARIYQIA